MSFLIKVGLNVWFYCIFPTRGQMIAKSMPKPQITNNQLFNWIWRFEIIVVNL